MNIGVTGCTSEIGERVCERIAASGFELLRIGRNETIKWEFGEKLPDVELDFLIHLAHDRDLQEKEFSFATELLLKSVSKRAFLIYLSSTSAHSAAISNYGKSKYIGERMVTNAGGTVVKSGLIYQNGGLSRAGILGTVLSIVQQFPIIPLPYRGKSAFYMTEIDALSRFIVECIMNKTPGVFRAFSQEVITFSILIGHVAEQLGKKRRVIPISDRLTKALLVPIAKFFGGKGAMDSFLSLSSEISKTEIGALITPKIEFPDLKVS